MDTNGHEHFHVNSRDVSNASLLSVELDSPLPSQGRGQGEGLRLGTIETPHLSPLPFNGERRKKREPSSQTLFKYYHG
jgi:hypothetical protein